MDEGGVSPIHSIETSALRSDPEIPVVTCMNVGDVVVAQARRIGRVVGEAVEGNT